MTGNSGRPVTRSSTKTSPRLVGWISAFTPPGRSTSVGCEAAFTTSPIKEGEHANGVSVNAGGSVQWVLGNLGAIPTVTIDYKTYDAAGWTILATTDGTRFTNNGTGHGMFVSIEKVEAY